MYAVNDLPLCTEDEFEFFYNCQCNGRVYPQFVVNVSADHERLYYWLFTKTPQQLDDMLRKGMDLQADGFPLFMERYYLNIAAADVLLSITRGHYNRKKYGPNIDTNDLLQFEMMTTAFRLKKKDRNLENHRRNLPGELAESEILNRFRNSKHFPKNSVMKRIEIATHEKFPILSCVPDAIILHPIENKCYCVEVKTVTKFPKTARLFSGHYFIAQLQLFLTKLDMQFTVYFNLESEEMRVYEVFYNHKYVLKNLAEIRAFFFNVYFPFMADMLLHGSFINATTLAYYRQKDEKRKGQAKHAEEDVEYFQAERLKFYKKFPELYLNPAVFEPLQ